MNVRHDIVPAGATPIKSFDELRPPQVLVVDDAEEIRYCLTFFLRAIGYRVLEAENGQVAKVILQDRRPALLISDLEMPVCDGWDLLAYCHSQHPKLPVMVISGAALGTKPDVEAWASASLPKPFSLSRFRTEVQRLAPCAA